MERGGLFVRVSLRFASVGLPDRRRRVVCFCTTSGDLSYIPLVLISVFCLLSSVFCLLSLWSSSFFFVAHRIWVSPRNRGWARIRVEVPCVLRRALWPLLLRVEQRRPGYQSYLHVKTDADVEGRSIQLSCFMPIVYEDCMIPVMLMKWVYYIVGDSIAASHGPKYIYGAL